MWRYVDKKHKSSKVGRKKRWFFVVLLLAVILLLFGLYRRAMVPTIFQIALAKVRSETAKAINETVCEALADATYLEFVTLEKNSDDDVVLISANSVAVNTLARQTSVLAQDKICNLFSDSLQLHWGTLSGVPLLNEKGPTVSVKISPIGSVECTFVSKFESAGINQTLHRIYLNVESKIDLIIPTMHEVLEISTPILVSETVIVGKIPQTFLQGGLLLGGSN